MAWEVSVTKCENYDDQLVGFAIEESLKPLGGLQSVVKKGDRVLIKPNLLGAKKPEEATTTHPAIVKAVVLMVKELGGTPVIGDSPGGGNSPASVRNVMRATGMQALADEVGCEIVDFEEPAIEVASEKAMIYKKFIIAKAVTEADVIIALPKLKTHQLTYYTGAVKLLYGYIPGIRKKDYHLHTGNNPRMFAELLLDLHEVRKPDLVIMDAVVGMEGNGPSAGSPREIGVILSSKSCTAMDFVASSIIGLEPLAVPTVKVAADRKVGPANLGEITIYGVDPQSIDVKDFKRAGTMDLSRIPAPLLILTHGLFTTKPIISARQCKKCGICARDCPPKAIAWTNGSMPKIDSGKCILCYCCQELCPEHAVKVHVPLPRKAINRLLGRV